MFFYEAHYAAIDAGDEHRVSFGTQTSRDRQNTYDTLSLEYGKPIVEVRRGESYHINNVRCTTEEDRQ